MQQTVDLRLPAFYTNSLVDVTPEEESFKPSPYDMVVAVIPAYNEERFIGSVVLKVLQYVDQVIVVDDGSTDDTASIARTAGAIVVQHEVNRGKGVALNTGFKKAKDLFVPDAVVILDGDWQHRPEELPNLIRPVLQGGADLVIGSRYLEKETASEVPLQRVVGHWGFTALINALSGTPLTDSQSGFRAFSPRALESTWFSSQGFSVESEMQFLARDYGLKVLEVPISIRYQDKPKRSVLAHGLKVLNGILSLVSLTRPLLFFTVPGFLTLVMGALVGLGVVYNYGLYQRLAVGTALLAVLLCFVGTLALFTGIILNSLRGLVLEFLRFQGAQHDDPNHRRSPDFQPS
jgi:glycosyltransferase involved in cell wall biosynthesis